MKSWKKNIAKKIIKICWLIRDSCGGCDIFWRSCCVEMHKRENDYKSLLKNALK
jgi:hypothetical protein